MEYKVDEPIAMITKRATLTTDVYMKAGVAFIDSIFGEGYSKNNPELVGQFMMTAAKTFDSSMRLICAQKLEEGLKDIGSCIQETSSDD